MVARALLGRVLVCERSRTRLVARIVEVEAYGGARDPASHAFHGCSARNAVMFGPPGHAYVYFTYGLHHCVNVVCGREGAAAAVLLRALEPLAGEGLMRRRRGMRDHDRLLRGPGCVAQALGLSREHDGADLVSGPVWIADASPCREGRALASGPRIGVRAGAGRAWRFWLAGHPCVSGTRAENGGPLPR